jgi:hypothetical protein
MARIACHAAITLALVAGTGAASGQTTIITREPAQTTVIAPVELTPAQRTTVYRTIVRERAAAPPVTTEMRIGTRVPQAVELQVIPEAVAVEVPALRTYRYMLVNNRVLLVDPATSTVVAELTE